LSIVKYITRSHAFGLLPCVTIVSYSIQNVIFFGTLDVCRLTP